MSAESIVTSLIESQTNFANDLTSEANGLVASAATAMNGQFTPTLDLEGLSSIGDVEYTSPGEPDVTSASMNRPNFQGDLSGLVEIDSIDIESAPESPELTGGDPASIAEPNNDVQSFNRPVPSIDTTFDDVVIPDIQEYEPLDLLEVNPTARDINVDIPHFSAVAPSFLGETPTKTELADRLKSESVSKLSELIAEGDAACTQFLAKHYPEYDGQVASMDTHLKAVIDGTTTAWSDNTQQKLYDLERTNADAQRERVEYDYKRNLGMKGAVSELAFKAASQRAEQEAVNASVMASYAVTEKRADRELQHLQFALSTVQQLRSLAQQTWLAYNQHLLSQNQFALSFATSCVQMYIEAHNLAIQRYNADLAVFQAEAQAWEIRIRNALIEFEIGKLELEYELAQIEVNQAKINELRSKIEVDEMKIRAAVAKINAISQQLENRKLPLEIFKAEIEAHRVYLDGRKVETDIYSALVNAQRAITDDDAAKVRNYATEVGAWQTEAQTRIAENQHRIDRNRYLVDVFRAWIDKFQADVGYEQADASTDLNSSRLKIDEFRVLLADEEAKARVNLENQNVNYQSQYQYDKMRADYVLSIMANFQEKLKQIGSVNISGAKVLSELAASIMVANGSSVNLINETTQTG